MTLFWDFLPALIIIIALVISCVSLYKAFKKDNGLERKAALRDTVLVVLFVSAFCFVMIFSDRELEKYGVNLNFVILELYYIILLIPWSLKKKASWELIT